GACDDCYALDLATLVWTRLNTSGEIPSPRGGPTGIYDPNSHQMIIYGGYDTYSNGGIRAHYDEAYALNLNTLVWQRLYLPGDSPRGLYFPAVAYASNNNKMYIFGGASKDYGEERWRYELHVLDLDNYQWSEIKPLGNPPSRRGYTPMIYDRVNNRMVVFGGLDASQCFNDTYALDLNSLSWSALAPAGTLPTARSAHSAIYDVLNQRMVVFGGGDSVSNKLNDVWALDLTKGNENWVQLAPSGIPPSPRYFHTAIYHSANHRMIVHGGNVGGDTNTYALDLTSGAEAWTQLSPSGKAPPVKYGHSAIYDASNHRMVVYNGSTVPIPDTIVYALKLTLGAEEWSQISYSGKPPSQPIYPYYARTIDWQSSMYDPQNYRMLTFGGYTTMGIVFLLRDTWILTLPNKADTIFPTVNLLYPNGGESFTADSTIAIRWNANDETKVTRIDLLLSVDGGVSYPDTIRLWAQVDTPYIWRVPNKPSKTCKVKVVAYDSGYNPVSDASDGNFGIQPPTGIADKPDHEFRVYSFRLFQNVPNPFSQATEIRYQIADGGRLHTPCPLSRGITHPLPPLKRGCAESKVSLKIYNVAGQLVKTLVGQASLPAAGIYTCRWDGRDDSGKRVASGVYFYRLVAGDFTATKKMILLR
ncbi:MAG: kelch repeat-containing protein, partial [Candidatus Edwardsbacteria bacterium]